MVTAFGDDLTWALTYSDYVFGNESEAKAIAESKACMPTHQRTLMTEGLCVWCGATKRDTMHCDRVVATHRDGRKTLNPLHYALLHCQRPVGRGHALLSSHR